MCTITLHVIIVLQANGQNIITSTHDEVVNIIVKSGKKLHLKVVTPTVKPAGLSKAQDSPRTFKKQQTVSSPTSPAQKIPLKPAALPQVIKGQLPNATQTTAVPRKPPPPPQLAQNSNSIVSPPAAPNQVTTQQNMAVNKHKLTKANTVDEYARCKQQTAKLTRQLSEEPVRPPSQFAAPVKICEEPNRNSVGSEDLSPFASALKKASFEREQRISNNQPRMSATVKNENITDIPEEKDCTPPAITQQGLVSNNPITSPLAKAPIKAINDDQESSSNLELADSADFTTTSKTQKTEVVKEKLPISNLIKRFSGEDLPALEDEATQLAPTKVEKTDTNFDQQQLSKVSSSSSALPPMMKKSLSSTKANKTFEGEKAEDGTYNWRNILRSVPKAATILKDTTTGEQSVPIATNASVPEKATNRQMQGSPITTKTSKTSLLAKKFERNSMIKAENMMTLKKTDEVSKKTLTGLPGSLTKYQQEKQEDVDPITVCNSSPVLPQVSAPSNNSASHSTTLPLETAPSSIKTEEQPLRRQSALVMVEETDFSKLVNQYTRSSFSVDSDYWNSPEHKNHPIVSENTTNTGVEADESVENEVFLTPLDLPELDILPPPMLSDDEDLSLAIEDLPPPDTLLPPEIGYLDQLHDLPPPLDFPDTDVLQSGETSPLPAPDSMFDMNVSDLPSPSQLPSPMEDFSNGEVSFSSPIPEPVSNQLELPLTESEPNATSADDYNGLSHEPQDITSPEMLPPPAPLSDSELENLPNNTVTSDAPLAPEMLPPPAPLSDSESESDTVTSNVPSASEMLSPPAPLSDSESESNIVTSNVPSAPETLPPPAPLSDSESESDIVTSNVSSAPVMLPPPAPQSDSEVNKLPTSTVTSDVPSEALLTEPLHKDNSADGTLLPPPEITSLNTSDLLPPMKDDQNETSEVSLADTQLKSLDEEALQVSHIF